MNHLDLKESSGTIISLEAGAQSTKDRRDLAVGCSQKKCLIENEADDDEDSFANLTDIVENSWIDDPEHYDLFDVMTRNSRRRNAMDFEYDNDDDE